LLTTPTDEMVRRVQQRIVFHRRGAAEAAAKWLADDYAADADALEQCLKLAAENGAIRYERDSYKATVTALRESVEAWKDLARDMEAERAGMYESIAKLRADLAATTAGTLGMTLTIVKEERDKALADLAAARELQAEVAQLKYERDCWAALAAAADADLREAQTLLREVRYKIAQPLDDEIDQLVSLWNRIDAALKEQK
jgi:hypothetical protein